MKSNMKDEHRQFCLAFLKCGNATQSAIEAGYSAKTARQIGSRLLKRVDIQEYLGELRQRIEDDKIADITECLEVITNIIRDDNVNTSDRLKAIDIRLKTLSAYETKVKLNSDTINITIDNNED